MRAAQREATIVAMGLVIVASIVVIYLLNEPSRREVAAGSPFVESVDRGAHTYVEFCLSCHGPEGNAGEGRLGVPLNLPQNMSDDPAVGPEREQIIRTVIERGRGEIMPAWAISEGGPFNQQQIDDLVNLIRDGAWDLTADLDREEHGGAFSTRHRRQHQTRILILVKRSSAHTVPPVTSRTTIRRAALSARI